MSNVVSWMLELKIKEGEHDNLIALIGEMSEATEADEPGALAYEWFVNDDKSACHIYERYADSAATMIHLGNFGSKFAKRFMGCLEPQRMTVYGDPDESVRKALASMGAVHFEMVGGFAR